MYLNKLCILTFRGFCCASLKLNSLFSRRSQISVVRSKAWTLSDGMNTAVASSSPAEGEIFSCCFCPVYVQILAMGEISLTIGQYHRRVCKIWFDFRKFGRSGVLCWLLCQKTRSMHLICCDYIVPFGWASSLHCFSFFLPVIAANFALELRLFLVNNAPIFLIT